VPYQCLYFDLLSIYAHRPCLISVNMLTGCHVMNVGSALLVFLCRFVARLRTLAVPYQCLFFDLLPFYEHGRCLISVNMLTGCHVTNVGSALSVFIF